MEINDAYMADNIQQAGAVLDEDEKRAVLEYLKTL